jgi:CTP:molybdopterin cytidylyltransferase MocA
MHRRIVSVLLTCGIAEQFPDSCGGKKKALLAVHGQPLFEYVLKALCDSQAEKVFVIQEADANLENTGVRHDKVVFANCQILNPSLADSLICALETLLDFYGEHELQQRQIMFVPCDIPLVTSRDFNTLMSKTRDVEVDLFLTFIRNNSLKTDSPKHHFRMVYFDDLGGYYSLQGLAFASGRLFRFARPGDGPGRVAILDRNSQSFLGLTEIVHDIRNKRSRLIGWVRFFSRLIFMRLIIKGHADLLIRIVHSYLFNKLTVSLIERAVLAALNVKFALVETRSAAFSVDIDTPHDLEYVKSLLDVTKENAKTAGISKRLS